MGRLRVVSPLTRKENTMLVIDVNDMTCGRCAGRISKVLKDLDPGAAVSIDLAHRRVSVSSAEANLQEIHEAIVAAGYTPASGG
jgi:copper chaperone